MNSKKIYLVVTPFFPELNSWRGAYVLDQVKAIQRNSDYDVVVFKCCGLREKKKPYIINGITVRVTPAWFTPSYIFSGLGNGLNGRLFLQTLKHEGIKVKDIAVVHSHTAAYACFSAAVKKSNPNVKSLVQYHDRDPYQILYGKFAGVKLNALFRAWNYMRVFKYLDGHVCISELVRDNLLNFPYAAEHENYQPYLSRLKQVRCLHRPKGIKTIVLYNGVDTRIFNQNVPRKLSSINRNTFVIGCIGNFLPLKGHMTLIKAVERIIANNSMPDLKVIFIGSGMLLEKCKKYIHAHDLDQFFEFRIEVKHEFLPDFYRSIDLFVLPTMYEGFGCVFTEAAACGTPFMICEHQGASEYIAQEDSNKWLIRPNDDQQLADMIERQYHERASQNLCKPYDIDTLISDYLQQIKKL